jgi:hypothetical protein
MFHPPSPSAIPAIAAGVSSYALFADAATIGKHLSIAADIVPAGALGQTLSCEKRARFRHGRRQGL